MKIAFFHELHSGGARRASNEFSKYLKKRHRVDLYLVDDKINSKEEKFYSNINFFYFKPKHWVGHDWKSKLYKDSIELFKLYKLHKKIAKIIDENQYDLVFVQGSKFTQAPFILRFIKTKNIYFAQETLRMVYEKELKIKKDIGLFKYYYENLNRYIRKLIDRSNIRHANKVLSNSRYTATNLKKAYGILASALYMGVDISLFKPIRIKKANDVLFIGAFGYMDGYPLLEQLIRVYKPKFRIKILASERKWVDNDLQLAKLYSKSKIALALGVNEPFGLIPLEAMACGLPVVGVNVGGYRETIVDGKTGYLVPRDAKEILDKIQYLLTNPKILSKMGYNAREYVIRDWTWEKNTRKLEKIMEG